MTGNMRIWEAVCKTDPAHTKAVEFGRKFTSIDAHWQIMQATKQFGPVGEGWGYVPAHSVITLTPEIILAVADVTIWWMDPETPTSRHTYGPIRATCEMYAPKTKFGKVVPGEFVTDEDAPKKAMTDALTKGLSHLGFSADVFLKLFDDNRYVERMRREFAAKENQPPAASTPPPGQSSANGRRMAADDPHLIDTTRAKGTMPPTGAAPAPDVRKTAEEKAKTWVDNAIGTLKLPGQHVVSIDRWFASNSTVPEGAKYSPIGWLEEKAPAEHERLMVAFNDLRDQAKNMGAA